MLPLAAVAPTGGHLRALGSPQMLRSVHTICIASKKIDGKMAANSVIKCEQRV